MIFYDIDRFAYCTNYNDYWLIACFPSQQGMGIFSGRNFESHYGGISHIVFNRSSFLRNELDLQQSKVIQSA
jgi:hypothetical protein